MKKGILTLAIVTLLFGSTALVLSSCSSGKNKEGDNHEHMEQAEKASYVCPMHPEITGKEGDKCSKCGMALKPAKNEEESAHGDHKH